MSPTALFTKQEIEKKVSEIAEQIKKHYGSEEVLAIGILKGAFVFYGDLLKQLDTNIICDFCSVSYYGDSVTASSEATIEMDVTQNIKNKNILIIDCIVDRGHTLKFIKNHIEQRKPKSIKTAALLTKPEGEKRACVDFKGFEVAQDVFVMGYGIDYKNQGRSLDHFVQVNNIN